MKVKVLKSNSLYYWYANHIGKLFEVVEECGLETHYRVVGPIAGEEPGEYMISKRDCIEVPDKWCVKVGDDNRVNRNHPVILYLNEKYKCYFDGSAAYYGVNDSRSFYDATFRLEDEGPFGKLLTLEEFELIFLNKKTEEMKEENKELIGYKLTKPELKYAIETLIKGSYYKFRGLDVIEYIEKYGENDSGPVLRLKELGVLDLWFTPVYKEVIKTIVAGDKLIDVEIIPGRSICALGTILDIEFLEEINVDMNHYIADNNNTKWAVSYPSVKIGCSTFTSDEINKIIEVYYGK